MVNIVNYFNYFCQVIFGVDLLMTPANFVTAILGYWNTSLNTSEQYALSLFIGKCISNMQIVFSSFVWIWFAVLTINLLIRYPFKWFKSLVKRK